MNPLLLEHSETKWPRELTAGVAAAMVLVGLMETLMTAKVIEEETNAQPQRPDGAWSRDCQRRRGVAGGRGRRPPYESDGRGTYF